MTSTFAFLSPFDNQQNKYLHNFRQQLTAAGFAVVTADDLWSLKYLLPGRQPRYLFLNWFEDRLIRSHDRSQWLRWAIGLYKLVAAKLQRAKIVWVRHNYRPHTQDTPDWVVNLAYKLLSVVSSHVVVHSEYYASATGYFYVPHPLYEPSNEVADAEFTNQLDDAPERIAVLGQMRPNKGLDAMLQSWPRDVPLLIAGEPTDTSIADNLQTLATQYQLDVRFILSRLTSAQFDAVLTRCRAVYIANPDQTMIVSGVFFHAASLGSPVVMNESAFADEMAAKCSFAVKIDSPSQLGSILSGTQFPSRQAIRDETSKLFGQQRFAEQVAELTGSFFNHYL